MPDPMPEAAVALDRLVKVYKGGRRAVDGVTLTIPPGEIYGLIGPNGAGKSTTIRILATLLKPTEGQALVFGHDVVNDAMDVRRIIAYLPEDPGAYARAPGSVSSPTRPPPSTSSTRTTCDAQFAPWSRTRAARRSSAATT